MNKIYDNLQAALKILDAQVSEVGHDLEFEKDNLRQLVAARDTETQKHITQLQEVIGSLNENLRQIRQHVVAGLSEAQRLDEQEIVASQRVSGLKEDSHEPDISPQEASRMRHDEPVTLTSIFRSLLMADEPAQRENGEIFK